MTTRSVPIDHAAVAQRLQETFVRSVLPRIEAHGRLYFRYVRCRHRKEELLAEMAALSWRWFVDLVRRGKDVLKFVSKLAVYAARDRRRPPRLWPGTGPRRNVGIDAAQTWFRCWQPARGWHYDGRPAR